MAGVKKAKWIWVNAQAKPDEYGEFFAPLTWRGDKTVCRISCDGDYALYINGALVSSNQYGDFEHYKIYDTVDITPYLRLGDNAVAILVWHFGTGTMRYFLRRRDCCLRSNKGGRYAFTARKTLFPA